MRNEITLGKRETSQQSIAPWNQKVRKGVYSCVDVLTGSEDLWYQAKGAEPHVAQKNDLFIFALFFL